MRNFKMTQKMKRLKDFNIGDVIDSNPSTPSEHQVEVIKSNSDHIMKWANIPTRYIDSEFKAANELQEVLVSKLKSNFQGRKLNDVNDMLIYGSVGTGKTHLVIAMLLKLIKANIYCRYATEHHLLDLYFQKKYTEFDGFKKVNILVIDELGKRELQDWQKIQLEELISYRYNEMLPTIFITNMATDEFKAFVGDRVSDRLRENKVVRVLMEGDSLRGKI